MYRKFLKAGVLCTALFCSYGAAAQSSTEGVSRQVQALKTAMENFRSNMNGRVSAMETQLRDCEDGTKYGTVEYSNCADPTQIGFTLRQCINGEWREEVDGCKIPNRQYVNSHSDGRHAHFPDDILLSRADRYDSDCFSADAATMTQFCRDRGFLGYTSSGNFAFSSCGDNTLARLNTSGNFERMNACAAGGVCALAITCTNIFTDVRTD